MSINVFLSHTSVDKPFVRKLAKDLENHGINYWLDERDIKIGQSLIDKIRQGLDEVNYVAVILSPASISSSWVQREIDVAMNQEIKGKTVRVLPIMYQQCELPGFLLGKLYVDFTEESKYPDAFKKLVESMGIVFNKKVLESTFNSSTLWNAIDRAVSFNFRILSHPFHRPFQYIGMNVSNAAKAVDHIPNEVGNIIVDNEDCHMLLEAEGNFISYVEVEFKKTAPCQSNQEFDSEPLLGALSINPVELDLVRKQPHCHTYYDHRKKLKVNVLCTYEGGPLSVSFSTKYYGM
ncbi:toll/interleukin-1 receptor domain-containing protein [Adhaeribacter arboris]|uniref:Toll/interleukin-1 receptor domain-containing protein n=1 Tax=Adhaeribacter arboris TaxID=2072846 RepID=A0A2T2YBP6_9BACT|nr:toll/interleukin-1 receptor domain-containing protein [Adhaeribacter arboris]PSR52942.1 toll/interleukin-1 receptor domain-containing protein [Adhaeribacter arboris]